MKIQSLKLKNQNVIKNFKFCFFILTFAVCFLNFHRASAATLYSQAANQDVYQGQTFVVDWYLDSEGQNLNTLDLKLDFSQKNLKVDSATTGNSAISLWVENPTSNNSTGQIELVGGVPNGISGKNLPIFRTVLEATATGPAFVKLDPSSQVLINDGKGTADELKFANLNFNIYPANFVPVTITSSSHPDQNQWSNNQNAVFSFTPKDGINYSYSFSSNIDIVPDNIKQNVPAQITYNNLPDGIYYFKLNSQTSTSNPSAAQADWQEAGIYRVQIDNTPPEDFAPEIGTDPKVFGGSPFVSFSTVDKTSGISHYDVKVGLFGKYKSATNPLQLTRPLIGDKVTVRAFDNAGNMKEETVAFAGIISTEWFEIIIGLIVVIIIGLITFFLKRKPQE